MREEKLQQLKGSHLLPHRKEDGGEAVLQGRLPGKKHCFRKAPKFPVRPRSDAGLEDTRRQFRFPHHLHSGLPGCFARVQVPTQRDLQTHLKGQGHIPMGSTGAEIRLVVSSTCFPIGIALGTFPGKGKDPKLALSSHHVDVSF